MSLELISEDERMAIRLIAFDMDDTLLRDDRTIGERTLRALRLSRNAAGIQRKLLSAVHGEGQQKLPGLSRNLSVHPLRCFRAEALHLRHDKAHVRICPRHAHIRSQRENFLNALRGVALYRLILARTGQRCRVQGRMLCTGHPHESGDHAAERVFAAAKVRIRKIQQLRAISRLNAQ